MKSFQGQEQEITVWEKLNLMDKSILLIKMVTNLKAPIKTGSEYLEKWYIAKPNVTMKAPFLARSFMAMEN